MLITDRRETAMTRKILRWVLVAVLLASAVVTFIHLGDVGREMPFEYYGRTGPAVSVTWNYYTGAFEWAEGAVPREVPDAPPGVAVRYWLLSVLFLLQLVCANFLIFSKTVKKMTSWEAST
jgi:hypothetical protein